MIRMQRKYRILIVQFGVQLPEHHFRLINRSLDAAVSAADDDQNSPFLAENNFVMLNIFCRVIRLKTLAIPSSGLVRLDMCTGDAMTTLS
jgi:hypothetical protein